MLLSDEKNYDREVMKYQTNAPKEKLLILQHYSFKVSPILYHQLQGS